MLDIASHRLRDVIRTALDGTMVAPSVVHVIVDEKTLRAISGSIGIAMAEDELTGQYIEVLQTTGARLAHSSPPRVVLGAPGGQPDGAISVKADFRPPPALGCASLVTIEDVVASTALPKTLQCDVVTDAGSQTVVDSQLQLIFRNGRHVTFRPADAPVTIGKSLECACTLTGDGLEFTSRLHARVGWDGQDWVLEDISTNGTLVNGALVLAPVALRDGDSITSGSRLGMCSATVVLA